jgi:hypothetical protein
MLPDSGREDAGDQLADLWTNAHPGDRRVDTGLPARPLAHAVQLLHHIYTTSVGQLWSAKMSKGQAKRAAELALCQ